MNDTNATKTVSQRLRTEIKVKGSRFIATAIPVSDRDEVQLELENIRKEFWDATHNCFAYQLAPNGAEYRFFDDGEPSGSAGKPILLVLQRLELMDVLIVVTRYYGGTKLGVGGLARAYGEAAQRALDNAQIVENWPMSRVRIFSTYDDLSDVRRLVEVEAESFEEEFKDVVIYTATIRSERVERVSELLTNRTSGRAGLINLDIVDSE